MLDAIDMDAHTALYYLTFIPSIVLAITFHEFAHARVALAFGDRTAYEQGRVTLNPLAHLDPIGTLGILFAGFGWGRPVPVNAGRLTHPRADLLVSAAGPATNLLLAVAMGLLTRSPAVLNGLARLGIAPGAAIFAYVFVHLNLMLAFFNCLPIGPLDGAHALESLLPPVQAVRFRDFNRRYGSLALLALILSGYVLPVAPLAWLLSAPVTFVSSLLLGG